MLDLLRSSCILLPFKTIQSSTKCPNVESEIISHKRASRLVRSLPFLCKYGSHDAVKALKARQAATCRAGRGTWRVQVRVPAVRDNLLTSDGAESRNTE